MSVIATAPAPWCTQPGSCWALGADDALAPGRRSLCPPAVASLGCALARALDHVAGAAGAPRIGPPADVFALAALLSEALAGRPLATPSARRPGALPALLREALAPAPDDRPTAAELAAGLAELAEPPAAVAA